MTAWKLVFLWILPCYRAGNEGTYECGAHGRFEYCIDDIPGCVVGCHCHPGYYFDTESKICEPNSKLTQNYRRNYLPQPTRIQNPSFVETVEAETLPTVTTHNVIDEHVNDITKNADDLGDWLYNQFFKTIENQVINKTNKDNQLTRRSGRDSNSKHNQPKLRARKRNRKHRKKKRGKRKKLLHIDEDDSLFQSSSDSESDSTYSESSGSSSSFESDSDEDHGHRKIIMINKKPKPPLPSFIFLPHMNTPYYPPIGLPPPPVMPMYPMVPVPPVLPGPPLPPCPGFLPECENTTTTTTTATITTSTTTTIPTKETTATDDKTKPTSSSEAKATSDTEETVTIAPARGGRGRYKPRKKKKNKSLENAPDYEDNLSFTNFKPSRGEQQKLLQQLRQRINNPNFKKNKKNYMNQLMPPNTAMFNNELDEESYKNEIPVLDHFDEIPEQENVDFKYLSQLIHRVNETKPRNAPSIDYDPNGFPKRINPREWTKNKNTDFNMPINSFRRMNQYENQRGSYSDDSYYSNLGRQIASLIRTIDADNNREFNIEIEKIQHKADDQLFFNDNSPRTFWERSVRSPLKFMYPFNNKFDHQKNSNEILFNIESKVENVVSTQPTLSLQEIENMIKVMETAQNQFQRQTKIKNVKPSSKTLNINLWPKEIKQTKNSIKSSARSPDDLNINKRRFINYANNTRPETLRNTPNKSMMLNFHSYTNRRITHDRKEPRLSLQTPVMKSISTNLYVLKNTTLTTFPQTIQNPNPVPDTQDSDNLQFGSYPSAVGYRNIKKYFFDDYNHYSFQNDNLPVQYSVRKVIHNPPMGSLKSAPYFHHEINHVDYISQQ